MEKFVILAGGTGSRMNGLTSGRNKHLLDFGGETVIERCLYQIPVAAEIAVVTRPEDMDHMEMLLPTVEVIEQPEPLGIGDALYHARDFAKRGPVTCLLGDNLFRPFPEPTECTEGARIYTAVHPEPSRFGCVTVDSERFVETVEEKPESPPPGCEIITGLYSFDASVWHRLETCPKPEIGELDMIPVLQSYADDGSLIAVESGSRWVDLGQSPAEFLAARNNFTVWRSPNSKE